MWRYLLMIFAPVSVCLCASESRKQAPEATQLIERYVRDYTCDVAGPPPAAYRGLFLDRLRTTSDRELKRFLVLSGLCSDIESELDSLERSVVRQGKLGTRKMNETERIRCEAHVRDLLRDLGTIDPSDSQRVIAAFRNRLQATGGKAK